MGIVDRAVDKAEVENGDRKKGLVILFYADAEGVRSPQRFKKIFANLRDKQGYLHTYNYY